MRPSTIENLIYEVDKVAGESLIYATGNWFGAQLPEEFWLERAKRAFIEGRLGLRDFESRVEAIIRHFRVGTVKR